MKFERRIGDVVLTVEAPDGVEVTGVMAQLRSEDRAAFLRAAEAVGGIASLILPTRDEPWAQSALAYACADDRVGPKEGATYVRILEPPREGERLGPLPHPFFGPLAERVERERQPRAGERGDGETEEER